MTAPKSTGVNPFAFLARMGASDEDRPAWLAERRQGITATEVLRIISSGKARQNSIDTLVAEKIEAKDGWFGDAVTEWGKTREQALADWAEFVHGYTREKRVGWAAGNRQHMASIDGWKVVDDVDLHLAEFKTSGERLTLAKAAKKRYVDQVQWQMYVTGAVETEIIWEERLDGPEGGFLPGVRGSIRVVRDEKRIAELVEAADLFLEALAAAIVNGVQEPKNDPMLDDLVTQFMQAKADVARMDEEVREWMTNLGQEGAKTEHWNISHTSSAAPRIKDDAAFVAANPEMAAEREALQAQAAAIRASIEEALTPITDALTLIEMKAAEYTKAGTKPKPSLRITPRKPGS